MNKTISISVVVAIIVGILAFGGGMFYGQSKASAGNPAFGGARGQQAGQRGGPGGVLNARRNGANFTTGQIIAQDAKSITVKMRDGGSKIIFLSSSTEFSKFASGTASDLTVGKSVTINGQANSDGSLTAQMIQIRPDTPPGSPAGQGAASGTPTGQ